MECRSTTEIFLEREEFSCQVEQEDYEMTKLLMSETSSMEFRSSSRTNSKIQQFLAHKLSFDSFSSKSLRNDKCQQWMANTRVTIIECQ